MNVLLPHITAVTQPRADTLVLALHIQPDLAYFSGHFPEQPLLPGVVQVDWAARFGRDYLHTQGDFLALDNLKFQAVIFPAMQIELALEWQAAKGRLEFSYRQNGRPLSSGRLCFAVQECA